MIETTEDREHRVSLLRRLLRVEQRVEVYAISVDLTEVEGRVEAVEQRVEAVERRVEVVEADHETGVT